MVKKKEKMPYLERDVSWMYFNRRILQEATRKHIPLLERLSFLGIYSNNLDEFFRVRVATQSRIAECRNKSAAAESERAVKIIKQINKLNSQYSEEYEHSVKLVTEELRQEGIYLVNDKEVTAEQLAFIYQYYRDHLNGFIMPVWLAAIKMLDNEADESIYLGVKFHYTGSGRRGRLTGYAYLELPVAVAGRFVCLPESDGKKYVMYLDDVVRCCLPLVFEGLGLSDFEAYSFKFTRDAEMEIDNDLRTGTLQKISKGVKSRKRGQPLRVLYDANMPKDLLKCILKKLDLDSLDTVLASGRYHNHKDFMKFPDFGRKDLKYPAWYPILKKELDGPESLLSKIQQRDRFIHVPYHSFDSFIRVLQEAAMSPLVKSIKITLYRLAKESKVVKALIGAARNGKKVTVSIELLARFDEASNIYWSKRMQEAGINVIFGVEGLKVHSKIAHISMTKGADIACIGTGNFHEGNARTYTDCMLMTASRRIVKEVDTVFGFIERPYNPVTFKELLVSPNVMRNRFVSIINDVIRKCRDGLPASIKIKINHITDQMMVRKIYEAAEAGVEIDLLVRGNCSLVVPAHGRIRITGIIDRFLEHSRIFIFTVGNEERVYIGSADWMTRNLDNRVEVVTPIYDPDIKAEMKRIVEYGLRDNMQGRIVDGRGENNFRFKEGDTPFRSQEELYKEYKAEDECYSEPQAGPTIPGDEGIDDV